MIQAIRPAQSITARTDYPLGLQKLILMLQQTPHLTPEQVKDFMLKAQITAEDLMPWADFDHPVTDSYGRKLVFHGGHFEIMVMSWRPGDFSAIHDHGSTQWGAVQCFGNAEHYIYHLTNDVLSTLKTDHYQPGKVCSVDNSLIHQMGNSSNESFLSLHVYGIADPESMNITGDARIFDLLEGCIQHTDGGVFFCLPEAQINYRSQHIRANHETTLRHHRLMGDRIHCILQSQESAELENMLKRLHDSTREILSTINQ